MHAGLILAGGMSSRMGGRDKALATLGGRTLLARAAARLGPQVGRMALSVNGDPARYALPGVDPVADEDSGRHGPLAGVLAGLRWAQSLPAPPAALVSAAVDTPFFPPDLAGRLAAATEGRSAVAVAASAGVRHPTFALWPLALADDLAAYLASGGRRVGAFIERHPHVAVEFAVTGGLDPFFNINTPADLVAAEEMLRGLA